MKRTTIWRRLNAVLSALVALMLLSVVVASWSGNHYAKVQERCAKLEASRERIARDIAQMKIAVLVTLLDPGSNPEQRWQEARDDLSHQADMAKDWFPNTPELQVALVGVRNFATGALDEFCGRVEKLSRDNPSAAIADSNKSFSGIRSEQERVMSALSEQVHTTVESELGGAREIRAIAWGAIFLAMVAGIWLSRLPSSAVGEPLTRLSGALERMREGDFTERLASGER